MTLQQLSLGVSFDYLVKRQRRKTIALHVLPNAQVEVRAPKWLSKRDIAEFVEQRSQWVLEQRQQALEKLATKPAYANGQYHDYLGDKFPLQISTGRGGVKCQDGVFLVRVNDLNNPSTIEKALENWYRKQAQAVYEERLFACFESFPDWFQDKYLIPEITVRKMKRRWGSCSRRGEITLNLSLIKMPTECIDYVIVHELCHLEAFNHGRTFYRLLALVLPDWKDREELIEELS